MKQILISICFVFLLAFLGCSESHQTTSVDNVESNVDSSTDAESNADAVGAAIPAEGATAEETPDKPDAIVYGDKFPKVLAVEAVSLKDGRWRFNVTLSSAYDTPQRYADAWRVLDEQNEELGIRILGHDHASEQPFTRSATIQLPENTTTVFVEGRDQANGWSGQRFEFKLQ